MPAVLWDCASRSIKDQCRLSAVKNLNSQENRLKKFVGASAMQRLGSLSIVEAFLTMPMARPLEL